MRFRDKIHELITGEALVNVPDNLSPAHEVIHVVNGLHERGFDVKDDTKMKCSNCRKWVLVSDYAAHICE